MNIVRGAFTGLTGLFLILLPLQFLFAGYGVFGGNYETHEAFGAGLLHGITLLMLLTALISKQWKAAGFSFLLFAVIFLQIFLVEIGRDADQPWVSALHPFLAFCYWPYVYFMLWKSRRLPDTAASPDAVT